MEAEIYHPIYHPHALRNHRCLDRRRNPRIKESVQVTHSLVEGLATHDAIVIRPVTMEAYLGVDLTHT